MRYGMSWFVGVAALLGAVAPGTAPAQVDKFYGEPVELRSNFIYFSSWKYVRQGQFRWQVERDPNASEAEKLQGAWLQGDGGKPARFELIDMPRGIRLVAEKAGKAPFQPGQMAAQVFDEGRYKTWYTQGIAADPPEPNSTKDKILPGYNSAICYAESTDGLKWETPKLGLIEYAGNKDNNVGGWTVGSRLRVVFRGDLNGSMLFGLLTRHRLYSAGMNADELGEQRLAAVAVHVGAQDK